MRSVFYLSIACWLMPIVYNFTFNPTIKLVPAMG